MNVLPEEKQLAIIAALAEGMSIRSAERITGVHRDTIMRLGVRVGTACEKMLDQSMRKLHCERIQVDEIWGFIGKKKKIATEADEARGLGDVWTFVAIDPETKVVPSFLTGKRDFPHTHRFITDLASRVENRVHLSSDGMNSYLATVEDAFGGEVDYGQIIKIYSGADKEGQRRYSPPAVTAVRKITVSGHPDESLISTSHVERQNLTMRMHCRGLTRLTNGFSKKIEHFNAAIALHFAYYNFVKIHSTIRCTPAMAAGVSSRLWKTEELLDLLYRYER
jgi:IS1 family transposase